MNLILIIMDTLRKDHVGAYGNPWIQTPHLDAFARESVLFTRCYPESLPTLPHRRAMHTGLRTYPYHGHHDFKGDFSGAPGWGPIPESQHTMAERLRAAGYRTALLTDCYHQFKPSKNFHRGFDEWQWVRGQETDPYRAGPTVPRERIAQHMVVPPEENPGLAHFLQLYLRNNVERRQEADYYPARLFSQASRWVWDNVPPETEGPRATECPRATEGEQKVLIVVDSFDPHEPWDPPVYYRRLYDQDESAVDVIQSLYGSYAGRLKPREVKRMQANYAGEVTMTDRWFGSFIETLRNTGLLDTSLVAVISDHGHNIGHEPGDKGLISKQGHPMTHAVADLVLMMRHPEGQGAGTSYDGLVYNLDVTSTFFSLAGIEPWEPLDGIDLWPKVLNGEPARTHVTIGWGPLITVVTDEWWYNANIWGEGELLYRVAEDPNLEHNLAEENPDVCKAMLDLAIQDAGGSIPDEFAQYHDKPGCTPFEDRSKAHDDLFKQQKGEI